MAQVEPEVFSIQQEGIIMIKKVTVKITKYVCTLCGMEFDDLGSSRFHEDNAHSIGSERD